MSKKNNLREKIQSKLPFGEEGRTRDGSGEPDGDNGRFRHHHP